MDIHIHVNTMTLEAEQANLENGFMALVKRMEMILPEVDSTSHSYLGSIPAHGLSVTMKQVIV